MPRKGTKAEFVDLLSRLLTHPECPGRLFDRITDALVEEQNIRQPPLSSPEYIACALYGEQTEDIAFEPRSTESDSEWPDFLEGVN